jgi:hypothetical protein
MSYEYIPYNSPPSYVIIGHGKERKVDGQVDGNDDWKEPVGEEHLSFVVDSGDVAYHDVIEIVRKLSSNLNYYVDFSRDDGEYIDIDVSYDPEFELGGLYLMYRGKIEDIWTLENEEVMTVSTLVEHVVENHTKIMEKYLYDNYFPKRYPIPEIRIWCLTCREHYVKEEERRIEPVSENQVEEDEWYNNNAGAEFNLARQRWVNGDGNESYEPYQLTRLKLPMNNFGNNGNSNYENGNYSYGQNGYGKGNGTHSFWGGLRKIYKKKKTKKKRPKRYDDKIDKYVFKRISRKNECPRT